MMVSIIFSPVAFTRVLEMLISMFGGIGKIKQCYQKVRVTWINDIKGRTESAN